MKEIIFNFFSDIGQKLVILVLVGTTALTTGSAMSKLVVNKNQGQVLGENSQTVIKEEDQIPTLSPTNTPVPTSIPKKITQVVKATPTIIPTATPTVIPKASVTPKPTVVAQNNTTNRCIVTIFGQLFDVTTLRQTHSGGDVFKCGTDMSSVYQSQHGTSLSRMAAYTYNPNSGSSVTPTTTQRPTVSPTPKYEDDGGDDDREDEEHRDRYTERREDYRREDEDD